MPLPTARPDFVLPVPDGGVRPGRQVGVDQLPDQHTTHVENGQPGLPVRARSKEISVRGLKGFGTLGPSRDQAGNRLLFHGGHIPGQGEMQAPGMQGALVARDVVHHLQGPVALVVQIPG